MRSSRACVVESLEVRTLLSAGDPDVRFGGDGVARDLFGGFAGAGTAGAVLPDGRVLVGGVKDNAFLLARYNPDGTVDRTFGGGDGFVTTEFTTPAPSELRAEALAVLPGGKILLAGTAERFQATGNHLRQIALARFTADGTPDATFGRGGPEGDGEVLDSPGPAAENNAAAHAVAALPDGKFVVAGEVNGAPAVFRYNADGTLDASFGGGDGIAGGVNTFGPDPQPARDTPIDGVGEGLALLAGGKILLTGSMQVYYSAEDGPGDGTYNVATLDRFNADGTADPAFGGGSGRVLVGGVMDLMSPVGLSDGHVLAVLPAFYNSANYDLAVARLNADGTLDRTFAPGGHAGGGIANVDAFGRDERTYALAVDGAGRILVTGSAQWPTGSSENMALALARLLPDGRIDASFGGGDGVVAVDAGMPDSENAGRAVFLGAEAGVADATAVVVGTIGRAPAVARFINNLPGTPAAVYEAELATVTGAAISRAHGGFTGTGYVDYAHATGDAVEFTVNAPAAGRYDLDFRYANGGSTARAMGLSVNGTVVPGGASFARTGSWTAWNSVPVSLSLRAGANKVRLVATGQSGPNVDSLSFRPVTPPAPATYQAESAVLSGPLAMSNIPGFTGGGFADYQHGTGDYVEFTHDAPTAGQYVLAFRYANGSTKERPLEVLVNGLPLAPGPRFAPTGKWSTWATETVRVTLAAGTNKLRLVSSGANGPNLDSLTVTPA